jgi:spore maturation protein CgeB
VRVLIIGRRKHLISAEAGLYRAMKRQGHQVWLIDDRKLRQRVGTKAGSAWVRLRAHVIRPERVLVFKPHDVTPEIMDRIAQRFKTTMWYRDLTVPPDPELVRRAQKLDTVFLTAGGQAPEWEALGIRRALWLPDGADRDLDQPTDFDPQFACDVAFIGRAVSPGEDFYRPELLMRLAKRFRVRVWGQNWQRWATELNWDGSTVYGRDFAKVCASAKIVIDIKPRLWQPSMGVYASNRLVRQLACRGFSLTRGTAENKELFREGEHCAWYDSEAEAVEKIDYYIRNDAERRRVAANGATLVQQHHMLDNRVHNLLTGEPYKNPLNDHKRNED